MLQIDGEAGVQVEETLNRICPDIARYLIEYSFGEIYARDGLDNRTKELAVVAALTTMGSAEGPYSCRTSCRLHTGGDPRGHHPDVRICGVPGNTERHEDTCRGTAGDRPNTL